MSENSFPRLEDRARGWLRFIWDKATTPDDWSSAGEPHAWWDRYSTPPMCSLGRFDLHETGYVLPVMCDITPAWREGYTRIADELVGRYTTFWSAIDWLTMIGHDPGQDRYPPEWLVYIPEHLRGRYDAPGWTANGVEPWGLQPDPIGADGNNFFRGFLNLLMCFYKYVAGDDKWEQPFGMAGYQDRLFEWDHHRLVGFIEDQWSERPQGVHCENTKVWPFCVSGAGLGLQLYDGLYAKSTHWVYDRWVDYARTHFTRLDKTGGIESFAFYHDPLEQTSYHLRDDVAAYAALAITPYVHPQSPEWGTQLYESAVRTLGWDDPAKPLLELHPDPRWGAIGLVMARELGDTTTEDRLRSLAERTYEPRFFGEGDNRFGWWFNTGDDYPRGQLASLMMLADLGEPGAWGRVFNQPNLAKFSEPTVEGVDYPALGVAQAWNDPAEAALWVETYAAEPSARGAKTSWRVANLPDPAAVRVTLDGNDFTAFRVTGKDTVEFDTEIGEHIFRIQTGYRGGATGAAAAPVEAGEGKGGGGQAARRVYVPAAPAGASCC